MALVNSESHVEQQTSQYAMLEGCMCLKLNVVGRVGWPDRLYLYKGRVLFIEYKRPGEKPKRIQEIIHDQLRKHGFAVAVVDNFIEGRSHIDRLTSGGEDVQRIHVG